MRWLKLKAGDAEGSYHVNADLITHMFRERSTTKICVVGCDEPLRVLETPEQIVAMSRNDADRT